MAATAGCSAATVARAADAIAAAGTAAGVYSAANPYRARTAAAGPTVATGSTRSGTAPSGGLSLNDRFELVAIGSDVPDQDIAPGLARQQLLK